MNTDREYSKEFLIDILTKARDRHLKRKQFADWALHAKSTYVCHAIRNAMDEAGHRWVLPLVLQRLVESHIGTSVMDTFLTKKFGKRKFNTLSYEQIQDWRALMLTNMIEVVKKEYK